MTLGFRGFPRRARKNRLFGFASSGEFAPFAVMVSCISCSAEGVPSPQPRVKPWETVEQRKYYSPACRARLNPHISDGMGKIAFRLKIF